MASKEIQTIIRSDLVRNNAPVTIVRARLPRNPDPNFANELDTASLGVHSRYTQGSGKDERIIPENEVQVALKRGSVRSETMGKMVVTDEGNGGHDIVVFPYTVHERTIRNKVIGPKTPVIDSGLVYISRTHTGGTGGSLQVTTDTREVHQGSVDIPEAPPTGFRGNLKRILPHFNVRD